MNRDLGSVLDESPLKLEQAIRLIVSLAKAISDLHASGDYWDHSENGIQVDDDFSIHGLGTTAARDSRLVPGQVDASRDILAPEYISSGAHDARSDVYAWGTIAYEVIAGKSPFRRSTVYETMNARLNNEFEALEKVRPECPTDLGRVIFKALSTNPNDRFQSGAELLNAVVNVTI